MVMRTVSWTFFRKSYANDSGDIVVLISSSGKSLNMLKGAKYAKEDNLNVYTATFTGFSKDNPLSKLGRHELLGRQQGLQHSRMYAHDMANGGYR